jgi:cytochrome P450
MSTPQRPALADLASPAILPNPYPVLAGLREASPFVDFGGALIVAGRHEDCSRILRDPRASSDRSRSVMAAARGAGASREGSGPRPRLDERDEPRMVRSFLSLDPPDHTRLRRLVSRAFTARVVARLRPRIRDLTDELLGGGSGSSGAVDGSGDSGRVDGPGGAGRADRSGDSGRVDGPGGALEVVSGLAYPLPVRIISELLGVPAQDHALFAGWSAALAHALQPPLGMPAEAAAARAMASRDSRIEFDHYFRDLIARRRGEPADDLLSQLVIAEDEGDRLTEDELIATCVLLLVAGHETTVSLISNAVLALLRHPDQLALLRSQPDLAGGAVEETLRYDAPVQLTSRIARGEMQVGPVTAPDGAVILLLLAAAGRDPAAFPEPDRFDIRRGAAGRSAGGTGAGGLGAGGPGAGGRNAGGRSAGGPGAGNAAAGHLAFAAGPHFCLGAPLARLEATIALQAFATRVTEPELDEGALVYRPNLNLRGPQRLVVRHAGIRPADFARR